MKLLLVEDDELLAESLAERLNSEGYRVDLAADCRQAELFVQTGSYAAVILDIGLPDGSGLSLLCRWRDIGMRDPVLALTARDSWEDKVDGLQQGADDYLTKPFHEQELLARLQALIRRASGQTRIVLQVGDVHLDESLK